MSKGDSRNGTWQIAQDVPSYPISSNGFSKDSGKNSESWTKPPAIRHPGSKRVFRNIPVPKFLSRKWNPKKIRIDFTGQLQERLVQSARIISVKSLLTLESCKDTVRGGKTC